jgi:hypothetical protein
MTSIVSSDTILIVFPALRTLSLCPPFPFPPGPACAIDSGPHWACLARGAPTPPHTLTALRCVASFALLASWETTVSRLPWLGWRSFVHPWMPCRRPSWHPQAAAAQPKSRSGRLLCCLSLPTSHVTPCLSSRRCHPCLASGPPARGNLVGHYYHLIQGPSTRTTSRRVRAWNMDGPDQTLD